MVRVSMMMGVGRAMLNEPKDFLQSRSRRGRLALHLLIIDVGVARASARWWEVFTPKFGAVALWLVVVARRCGHRWRP